MNQTFGALIAVVTVLAIAVVFSPDTNADCLPWPRQFATIAGGPSYDKTRIDSNGAENMGNEIGRFWQSSASSVGNNFDGDCPSQGEEQSGGGWWQLSQPPLRGLRGFISGAGCSVIGCPNGDLTVLVEDKGSSAWPNTAFFIALRVDQTPEETRWWDFARVDPSESPSVLEMQRFPTPAILQLEEHPTALSMELEFPDVAQNVHAVNGPDDFPLPASAIVKSYDLYIHRGSEDPGREVDSWELVLQRPYEDGPASAGFGFQCSYPEEEFFLALGLTFHGGAGPDVVSTYVGSTRKFSCEVWHPNPAGAVPDGRWVPGPPLRLDKRVVDGALVDITLSWSRGCHYQDYGHTIYEGILGDFESHVPLSCPGIDSPRATILPLEGDTYYLIVPYSWQEWWSKPFFAPSREGSHGRKSTGEQRPRGLSPCLQQWIEDCP